MNRRNLLIGASAVGLAAFAAGTIILNRRRSAEAEAVAAATPAVDPALLVREYSPSFGPADAPVTLVEFFDPSCEACRAYHPVVQEIRRQFPTQVRVVLRYTVFHEGSDEAVRILEAARMQDKFEPVLDALLEQQPGWAVHGSPEMDVAWEIAGAAGLDLGDRLRTGGVVSLFVLDFLLRSSLSFRLEPLALGLHRELSAEDAAFREEMRTFFTTKVPQSIRDTVAARQELSKEQIVESQRILNAAGLAVPGRGRERRAQQLRVESRQATLTALGGGRGWGWGRR